MKNIDRLKNARSNIEFAKILAFKIAQALNGKLNDQTDHMSFEKFHDTREKFEKIFLSWLEEENA